MKTPTSNVSNKKIITFTVPANFSSKTIQSLAETKTEGRSSGVVEVYGSLNPEPLSIGSGRDGRSVPQVGYPELKQYVRDLEKAGIDFNYTLNTTTLANREFTKPFRSEFHDFINSLRDIGINRITIALLSLLDHLVEFKDMLVSISTLANLVSPSALHIIEKYPNVDRLCVPEYFNRNLTLLSELKKATRLELYTIVNTFCMVSCSFRQQHYNFTSFSKNDTDKCGADYFMKNCSAQHMDNPATFLSIPWIRPEDIDVYADMGITLFKLIGRDNPHADTARVVKHYQERSYTGNLIDLFNGFVDISKVFASKAIPDGLSSSVVPLDSNDVAEVMPRILSRKMGCHELLCQSCGICGNWAKKHL